VLSKRKDYLASNTQSLATKFYLQIIPASCC